MAQSGKTPIQIYGSTTSGNIPSAANLTTNANGVELAVNAADGKLFYKDSSGVVQTMASKAAAAGAFSSVNITGGSITGITDLAVADGGTGASAQTAYAVLCGGTTSTGAYQSIASVGTAGQILTSNGAGALPTFQAAGGGFAAGTAMLFVQTSAPTGWTKSTTHNDKSLRVVSGSASSGGSSAFSTVFTNQTPTINVSGLSAGATTLSTTQIPSHTHSNGATINGSFGVTASPCYGGQYLNSVSTGSTGGGGSHSHSISGSATSSAITLAVQYVDVIIATKD